MDKYNQAESSQISLVQVDLKKMSDNKWFFYLSYSMMHWYYMVLDLHRYTCNKHIKQQTRLKVPENDLQLYISD